MARGRQQRTVRDRLIPREVWEADEARRRARRDRGVDSDESTDDEENEANDRRNNDPEVPADPVDPEDEDSIVETIEAVLRQLTIAMFRRVLNPPHNQISYPPPSMAADPSISLPPLQIYPPPSS